MSTSGKKLSLSHPLVIGTVVVLMAVVVVVNVRTFAPRQAVGGKATEATTQAYPSVPVDLEQVLMRSSGAGLADPAGGLPQSNRVGRDPFSARPKSRSTVSARKPVKKAANPATDALVCAAIMLGGKTPLALINGQALGVGDKIRNYRVVGIGTDGVQLRGAGRSELFLEVGRAAESNQSYRMVTEIPDQKDQGRTSLDEKEHKERRKP